jgi:hypothetical protein
MTAWEAGRDPDPARPAGELLSDLADELRRLAQAEVRLALTETRRKAKRLALGSGALGTAAVLGLAGIGVFAACAVLALALVLPAWLAALLVGVGLFVAAGMAALTGRFALRRAWPLVPRWAMDSVRADIEAIRKGVHR